MNSPKTQNPILVLATLGVYLGLLMAGATPQILAQAATAKQFSVKDEAGRRDELDKKPDDCSEGMSEEVKLLLNLNALSDDVLEYVTELQQLVRTGKIRQDESDELDFVIKSFGHIQQTSHVVSSNRWFEAVTAEHVNRLASLSCPWADCRYYRYDPDTNSDASISFAAFSLDANDLTIKITTEQKDYETADKLAGIYQEAFKIGSCSDTYATPPQQSVYQNSKASFSNNQVLVISRLPRGSLDALLAEDAK